MELHNKAAELYRSGLSIADAANELGYAKTTVLGWLHLMGVPMEKISRLSRKAKGKKNKLGVKLSPESCARISAALKEKAPTTLGKVYSPEEKANISAGLVAHYARQRAAGMLLSIEERAARNKTREIVKRLVRRVLTMARKRKDARTETLLGYTKEELRAHLEAQFKPGMSWDKRESFHIDHIVPAKWFFDHGIFDIAKINALSNLQVLTPEDNRAKGATYSEEIESLTPSLEG